MAIRYIGLDFEASGSEPWGGSVPIEIGLAVGNQTYTSLIGRWNWIEFDWNEKAAQVHGIDRDEQLADAPSVWQVDIMATAWLIGLGFISNRMFNVTVGWNVAGYDRQFVTRWMPNLNRLLSYRTADLNAMVFALAGTSESEFGAIKSFAQDYGSVQANMAMSALSRELVQPHRAGYDAQAALGSFDYLRLRMGRKLDA